MRVLTLRTSSPLTIHLIKRLCFAALIGLAGLLSVSAQGKQQTISGYADYYKDGSLIVEGQRIVGDRSTVLKKLSSFAAIPLGSEVKVKGTRQPDGSFLAREIEVKQNGMAMFEHDALSGTTALENLWVSNGMMLRQGAGGQLTSEGQIISEGPGVDRVRGIMARLLPPYIRPDRVRVRLVENEDWNASAMANGAIWVHTSLLRDMSDDELAIILGHELAHFTYEHTRRQLKQQMWINLAASAAGAAAKNPTAQQYLAMGFSAWSNGYSRDHEDQADRVGLRYAYEAGFDVEKGSRVWLRFLERHGESDKLTNIMRGTHTRPSERYAHLQKEISLNYGSLPPQPTLQRSEIAATGESTNRSESTQITGQPAVSASSSMLLPNGQSAVGTTFSMAPALRRPDSVAPSLAPQPPVPVPVNRPLPPHVVRNASGKIFPASGYEWVNPTTPNDLRVRLMSGLVSTEDGMLRPAIGYEWINPAHAQDFRVKLRPGLVKTAEGLRPDRGYKWVNGSDPNDLRVEQIP